MEPFTQKQKTGGWEFVVRDNRGQVLAAGAGHLDHVASAAQAGAIAAHKGIQYGSSLGMMRIILETDAINLASTLN